MAEQGFILDIDARFLANLQKADVALKNSIASSQVLTSVFTQTTNGTKTLAEQLADIKTKLMSLKHVNIENFGGLMKVSTDARTAMDSVNLLVKNMKQYEQEFRRISKIANSSKSGGIPMLASKSDLMSVTDLMAAIKAIKETQKSGVYGGNLLTPFQTQFLNEQVALYQRAIAELSKTDDQRIQAVVNTANREVQEVKKKVSAVLSEERRLAKEQSIDVREAIAMSKTAKGARDLTDALRILKAEQSNIDRSTRKGELAYQMLGRAIEATRNKIAQASPREALDFSKNARTINEMRQALTNLQAAKGELIPGAPGAKQKLKELNKEIARLKKALGEVDSSSGGFKSKLDQLKSGIAGAFGLHVIGRFASQLIKIHAEFEKINISLKVLIGNSAQAEMLWGRITNLALKSPFTIQQLAQSTKQMAAYRIETNKLYSSTKMLADISAGLGVEMSRLILAYGQVKAANFLRGTELRQFSEAGIDMLGQLASYFSEMEGKAVSAADVFERISKRQVLFEDVDAVLRRVTSTGGAFYEMQEKQAQTLAGQISNLKDSIQMMFHDIGTSSHGVLLGVIKMARTLIDNWEVWVPLLASSAASLILIKSTLMAISAIKAVGNLFSATPILGWSSVAIAGVLAVLSYLGIFKDKVEEASESLEATSAIGRVFEEQQRAIEKAGVALTGYTSHINRLKKEQEDLSNEESRYIQNANLIEELITARSSAVAELAGKNSKVAESIGEIINKEQELIEWYTKESKKYARRSILADAFNVTEDDSKVLRNYEKTLNQLFAYSGESLASSGKYKDRFEAAGKDPNAWAEIAKEYIKEFTNISSEIRRAENAAAIASANGNQRLAQEYYDQVEELEEKLRHIDPTGKATFFNFLDNFMSADKVLSDFAAKARDKWLEIYGVKDVADITEEHKENIIEDFEDIMSTMDEIPQHVGYMRHALSETFNFEWDLPEFKPTGWQKRYNEWIEAGVDAIGVTAEAMEAMDRAFARISKEGVQESKIIEGLKEAAKSTKEIIDAYESYTDAQKNTGVMRYTLTDYEDAQTKNQIAEYLLSFYGQDGEDKSNKGLRDALSSIKEVYKAYKDLREVMSEPSAKIDAWKKYRGMIKEALDKAGIDIDSFIAKVGDMTSENSVIRALEELKKKATTASDKVAIEKAIGEFKLDVKLDVDETEFDKAMNDAQRIIDGYQLGVELDKLHIPRDFAQQFFDLESQNLPELRLKIMTEFENLEIGSKEEKEIQAVLRKVDDLEAKAQQERLKKYLQYTRNVVGERGKILMEEFDQLREISKTFVVTNSIALSRGIVTEEQLEMLSSFGHTIDTLLQQEDDQILGTSIDFSSQQLKQLRILQEEFREIGEAAGDAVRRDAMEKLGKFDWNAFKGSETFMSLYTDLANTAPAALQVLVDKMEKHRDQWSKLPIDQVKEYTKLLEQARDAIDKSKAPREIIENAFKNIKETGYSSAEKASADMADAEMNIQRLEQERSIIENIERMRAEGLGNAEISNILSEEHQHLAKETSDELDEHLRKLDEEKNKYIGIVSNTSKYLESVTSITNAYKELIPRLGKFRSAVDKAFDGVDAIAELLNDGSIAKSLVSFAKDTSNIAFSAVELVYQFQAAKIGLQNAGTEAEIFGYKLNMAMGIIGWIVLAIQLIAKGLKFAFEAHDKNIQGQIDKEIEKVEALKKSYEALEKQLEDAYKSADIGKYTKKMNQNLEQQIEHTENMIELEKDKKDPDEEKIKDWEEQIEDMEAQMAENINDTFNALTDGILENILSAARDFVDAWYDAFQETGDGMQGLQDSFKEMFSNLLKQQASMNIVGPFLDKFKKQLEQYISVDDTVLDAGEARSLRDTWDAIAPKLNESLVNYFGMFEDVLDTDYGELSGLEKGIQGMTEEQAEVLAAYWNSCRFMLSNIDTTLTDLASAVLGRNSTENPVVSELKRQTEILRAIDSRLESIIGSGDSTHIGSYVKVLV